MKKTLVFLLTLCLALGLCSVPALAEEPAAAQEDAVAVPEQAAETLEAEGPRAWLGVVVFNEEDLGVLIVDVDPDSPAAKAGVHPGDVITAINDQSVADSDALVAAAETLDGSPFTMDVLRRGSLCTVTVDMAGAERIGIYIAEGAAPAGVTVLEVNPDSPAEKAGLWEGDVIVAFNEQTVVYVEDLVEAVQSGAPGDAVEIELLRDGGRHTVIAVLGEAATEEPEEPEEPAEEPAAEETEPAALRVGDLPLSVEVRKGSSGALLTVCAEGALDEDASFIWYKVGKDGISYPMDSFFLPQPEQLGLAVENSFDAERNVYLSTLCAKEITAAASGSYFCRVLDVSGAELDSSVAVLIVR